MGCAYSIEIIEPESQLEIEDVYDYSVIEDPIDYNKNSKNIKKNIYDDIL